MAFRILALDMATKCGYAIGDVSEKPRFGTWRLKDGEDAPARAARNLGCHIRDLMQIEKPDLVSYEAPLSPAAMAGKAVLNENGQAVMQSGFSNSKTAAMLLMLPGAVEAVCGCYGVRTVAVHVQSVRKVFLGTARPEEPKLAVMGRCRQLGFRVTDDNAADALAVWHYEVGKYREAQLLRRAGDA